jgi:hypothetical protein
MGGSRFLAALGSAAVAAGMVVGVAGATTNVVPNWNFEEPLSATCSVLPCRWHASSGATIASDTSTFHSASASLRVDAPQNDTASASSTCAGLTAGKHEVSYWYNNSGSNINASATRLEVLFFSGANCTGFISALELFGTGTGGWLQAVGTMDAPPGTTSTFFTVYASCTVGGACSGRYDDIDFEAEVLAVRMSSFTASRSTKGVSVRWRTHTEIDTLGFHVFRSRGAKWTRVDRQLIPAHGSVSGARYSFLDRRAPRGRLSYRLQAVGTDGSRTWYGRATVIR